MGNLKFCEYKLKLFLRILSSYSIGYVPKFRCAITVFTLKKRMGIGRGDLFRITRKIKGSGFDIAVVIRREPILDSTEIVG